MVTLKGSWKQLATGMEKWKVEPSQRTLNFVTLKSCHDKYLGCDDLGETVRADRQGSGGGGGVIAEDPGRTLKYVDGSLMVGGAVVSMCALAIPLAALEPEACWCSVVILRRGHFRLVFFPSVRRSHFGLGTSVCWWSCGSRNRRNHASTPVRSSMVTRFLPYLN